MKFTDQGIVQIGAHAVSRADGGVALTFSFRDTGRGIPHEAQARLFQAFAQGEDVRGEQRPRATGTGLGLHIASEIVFLMDGMIEFRSEPGAGSEFWFTLELNPAHTAMGHSERGPRRRVALVIDGDPDFIATHVDILATAGIDADPVATDSRISDWPDMTTLDAILVHIPAMDIHDGKITFPESIPNSDIREFAYIYAEDPEIHRRLLDEGFAHVVQKTPDPRILRDTLERALDQPGNDGGRPPWSAPAARGSESNLPGKVLVVDDQPVNLKLLESFLEGTGWETVAATGSDEALYHARLTRFDAILMDIHLPERDGIETSAILRTPGELNAHTPILAITADAFAEQAHAAMAAGMNDVLVKPVSRTTLLERLSQWCHRGEHEVSATEFDEKDGTPPSNPPPYYDPDDARTRAGGRSGVADELFTMLCQHLPSSRAELRSALDRDDPQALLAAAHRLKGAAAYCGVPRLRHDIAALENDVRSGDDPTQAVETVCNTIDVLQQLGENGATETYSSDR